MNPLRPPGAQRHGAGGGPGATRGAGPSAWRAAWLPAAGLLGVVLPITFLQRLQSYAYHLQPLEWLGAYGTTVLMVLPAALVLGGLAALSALSAVSARWAGKAPSGLGAAWQAWPQAVFAALMAGGLYFGLRQWWASLGLQANLELPRAAWAPVLMVAAFAASARVRRALRAWHRPAGVIAAIGLCSVLAVPAMGWPDATPAVRPAPADRPHLVLLTYDALSASRMSLYGAARPTTPQMERWAASGVVMERFYAGSNYTTTALNTLLTGRHAHEHGALQLLSVPTREARQESLPAVLKAAGYRTLAVSTNPLGGPLKNGLGAYFDAVASDEINTYFSGRDGPSRHLRFISVALDNALVNALWQPSAWARWRYAAEQAQNRHFDPARAFAAAQRLLAEPRPAQQPVFLWVHVLPPHSPYAAPAPFLGMFEPGPHLRDGASSTPPFMWEYGRVDEATRRTFEARYDESVRHLDAEFEAFVRLIEGALGLRTVLMVSADHGESFSHGYGGHAGPMLHEPLVRIPLIARGPGLAAGLRLQTVAGHVDLAATIADLAGARPPDAWRGRSLAQAWKGAEPASGGEAVSMNLEQSPRSDPLRRGAATLVTPQWKLVQRLGEPRYAGAPSLPHTQLFRLDADPAEARDLAPEEPQVRTQLQQHLARALGLPAAPLTPSASAPGGRP